MKFVALIYGNQEKWQAIPTAEWPAAIAKLEAFNARYRATGELLAAHGLADPVTAKLVRRENGVPVVTDGPYIKAEEHIARFYLFDVDSAERAREIAADMPCADGDPVELWPVMHESAPDV